MSEGRQTDSQTTSLRRWWVSARFQVPRTRFFCLLTSTMARTVVFSTCSMTNTNTHHHHHRQEACLSPTSPDQRGTPPPSSPLPVALSVTLCTMCCGMVASTTTDLPRPSIQLMAAGFLSVPTHP